jgi:hypothetical protein
MSAEVFGRQMLSSGSTSSPNDLGHTQDSPLDADPIKNFGASLKRHRLAAGLSIADASRKLMIEADELVQVEAATSTLGDQKLRELCTLYRIEQNEGNALHFVGLQIHNLMAGLNRHAVEEGRLDPKIARELASLIPTRPVADEAGVFISYRRSDQPALAGRLYDKLLVKFNEHQVFMDVDSIDLGLDFVQVLERTLAHCKALIVVIGRDWLNASDEDGQRRLDLPDDFVRLEIETALRRNIRVIPILVDGTRMPRNIDLPESLRPLARRQSRDIRNARFTSDCLELVSTLERILATGEQ